MVENQVVLRYWLKFSNLIPKSDLLDHGDLNKPGLLHQLLFGVFPTLLLG